MKKSKYLIVLFIISFGYFSFLFETPIYREINLILSWAWGGFGLLVYRSNLNNALNNYANKKYVYWFIGIMLISTLYPYFKFNQAIVSTLISQRFNYSIFFLVIFLRICPAENDIFIALRFCSYLTIVLSIISIFSPEIFLTYDKLDSFQLRQKSGSSDIIAYGGGVPLSFMYFFVVLNKLYNNFNRKLFFEVSVLVLFFILLQNRSRLIFLFPILFYSFIKIKTKFKVLIWFFILLISYFSYFFIYFIFDNLYAETLNQLNDESYNRWQSVEFYLIEFKSNLFTVLFGHGYPSVGSDYLILIQEAINDRFAILSDIGLLGSYFFYGIFFVAIIYSFCFNSFKKYQPLYLKFNAIFIVFVPTIQGFGHNSLGAAILFSIFFYLILYHQQKYKLRC